MSANVYGTWAGYVDELGRIVDVEIAESKADAERRSDEEGAAVVVVVSFDGGKTWDVQEYEWIEDEL
jgi:hypothetical protein